MKPLLIRFATSAAQIGLMLLAMAVGSALQRPPAAQTVGLHLGTAHATPTYTVTGRVLDPQTLQPIGTYERRRRFEGRNPGVYVRLDGGATLGVLRNSYGTTSAYAGWTWQTDADRYAITLGVITGYPGRAVAPLVVPSVRIGLTDATSARLSLLPRPPGGDGSAGLHLSLERRF